MLRGTSLTAVILHFRQWHYIPLVPTCCVRYYSVAIFGFAVNTTYSRGRRAHISGYFVLRTVSWWRHETIHRLLLQSIMKLLGHSNQNSILYQYYSDTAYWQLLIQGPTCPKKWTFVHIISNHRVPSIHSRSAELTLWWRLRYHWNYIIKKQLMQRAVKYSLSEAASLLCLRWPV